MNQIRSFRALSYLIGIMVLVLALAGCAALDPLFHCRSNLPPILRQDELIRPYDKIARIEVTREVYLIGFDGLIPSDIHEWGLAAVRSEAAKMGADAVIFPEVTGSNPINFLLPSTEYRATGVAIKFK